MAKKKHLTLTGKLQYPKDLNTSRNDYVQFAHAPYKVNDGLYGRTGGTIFQGKDAHRFNPRANIVQLYMPNSTPATPNDQGWNSQTFPGDRGQLSKQLLAFAAGDLTQQPGLQRQADLVEVFKQNFLDGIAKQLGSDAATALQLGKGQVYNPNVEMMYKMPSLRQFKFDFDFIPKNSSETTAVDSIIREFKYWSSPRMAEGGKFLTVPDVWNITYFEGGTNKQFRRLNKFRYCVLESVRVTENPKSNYHMTIDDPNGPAPVHTSLSLLFTETDIITQQDHEKAYNQGYQRVY